MDIDKSTIKALASETRLGILKQLTSRRMMPSELSKRLGMSPSTVSDHLKILESANLIKRKDTGHKWIYYELTNKSQLVLGERISYENPIKFVLGATLGIIFLIAGMLNSITVFTGRIADTAAPLLESGGQALDALKEEASHELTQPAVSLITQTDISVILMVLGLSIIITSIIKWRY